MVSLARYRSGSDDKWPYVLWSAFYFILMFIFERERERSQAGKGQRERKTQNPKQAPGSQLSAQPYEGLKLTNHEIVT